LAGTALLLQNTFRWLHPGLSVSYCVWLKTIVFLVTHLCLPACLPAVWYMVLIGIFWLVHYLHQRRAHAVHDAMLNVKPLVILSCVQVMMYFYPMIASATLSIFSCRYIDHPASVPGEVVAAEGLRWMVVSGLMHRLVNSK
jgi:hypothetical protein